MKTDEFIQRLARGIKPARPILRPVRRGLLWTGGSVLYLCAVVLLMAPGAEWRSRLADVRFTFEQLAALATGAVAAAAALMTVIPGYGRRAVTGAVAAVVVWVAAVAIGTVQDVLRGGMAAFQVQTDWPCVFTIIAVSAAPGVALGRMTRRGAPLTPRLTLGLVAVAAVMLANVVACLLRMHETNVTVLIWHGSLIAAATVATAMAGASVLKWRPL